MDMIPFSFSQPVWLWLLALLPLAWWLERRSLVLLPRVRRLAALVVRSLVIALLVLALAGLRVELRPDELTVLFAVDRSESIAESEVERALSLINQSLAAKRAKDRAGVVVFGEDALVERAPSAALTRVERLESAPRRGFTDVSKALRLAAGLFPEGGRRRIVLFTDGNENLGSAATEASAAAADGIPVDVVSLKPGTGDEVLVESVQAPERVDRKKPFDVKVTVRSTFSGPATLRLYKDRNFLGQQEVELSEGKNVFLFPQQEDDSGFHTYEAMVDTPRDTVRDNNQAASFAVVAGEPRVLLVGADEDTRFLLEALRVEGIQTDVSQSPPASAAEAENYDAILLCNVSSEGFSGPQMKLLQAWTGDLGGGLAMTGGENAFGLGGWRRTPVEEALPVSMEIKDKKNFPSLGLVVLVDKSGSMAGTMTGSGGKTKLEIAAEAAVAATQQLTERDWVGVVGFDSAAKWDCPWQLAKDKAALADAIRSLRPGGGTDAMPAFNEAIRALGSQPLQHRHVIFVTDGMVMPGDYERVTRELQGLKATVTCIGVGDDADRAFLENLARANNGRFYFTNDPNSVPRIFTKEAVIAQRSYLIEEKFTPVWSARNDVVKGISALPQLGGYVAVEPKDRAEMLMKSPKGDVLLATWRYRGGKGLAWMSDARDRWGAEWVEWPDYKKFWSQAVRWLMRNRGQGVLTPRVTVENGTGRIVVDAVTEKGEFVNFLDLEATVLTPSFETRKVRLRQTGAGQYQGEFEARETGTYLATAGGENAGTATAGTSVSYPPEYRATKPDFLLMNQIASATGGKMDPAVKDFFRLDGPRVEGARDLWWHLMWTALFLFVADIALRRVFLDEEQKAQIAAWLRRLVPQRSRAGQLAAEAAAGTLGALKARRQAGTARRAEAFRAPGDPPPAATAGGGAGERPAETKSAPRAVPSILEALERKADQAGAGAGEKAKPESRTAAPRSSSPQPPAPSGEADYTSRLLEARRKARERTRPPDQ